MKIFLRHCLLAWLAWLLLTTGPAFAQPRPAFTAEEQRWIKDNPVIRYATDTQLPPIEYVEKGEYKGLASEYLKAVSRKSGLRFELVPSKNWQDAQRAVLDGEADLFPNVSPPRVSDDIDKQLLFSAPYLIAATIIVTRSDAPVILDMTNLNGKVVAIRADDSYATLFASRYPEIRPLFVNGPEAGLNAVSRGEAYAAVGSDFAFLPLIRRKYTAQLSISGTAGDLPYTMQMGVRKELPLLHSIIEKSLGDLSAKETDDMSDKWLEQTDFGKPSVLSIIRYRAPQVLMLIAGVMLLGWFAYRARVAQRAAQKSEEAKSRFLAIMSHEIRTPMNAVLASIEMLQRSPMDDRQRRLASTASTAAESLLGLLDDVLDLSKLDAERLELELIPTDIGLLAHKAADVTRANARSKNLSVNVTIDNPSESSVLVDPTRLRQVLMNLLGNSVKFTERGRIDLEVCVVPPTGSGDLGGLSVTVADAGVGIPLEQQSGVFEAYSQAGNSTTRRYGGTGLGLTICKELIELMGGKISLQSESGVGTRITFTLPARLIGPAEGVHAAADRTMVTDETPIDAKGTVLVVEDHPGNQFIISEQLRELGVNAEIVSEGNTALAAIRQQSFALVLMDCHMPDMSGYETTRRIREREKDGRHIPIIAISAATDSAHLTKCLDSGMDGVLKKPLRLDELRGMLQLWLGEAAQPARSDGHTVLSPADLRALYKASMKEDMAALQATFAGGDLHRAAQLAHRIKGAALMADAGAVGLYAEALEAALESDAQDNGHVVQTALDYLQAEVARWTAEPSTGPELT
jgi:two-component system, NarL family, sensor histidine kinase EvgS